MWKTATSRVFSIAIFAGGWIIAAVRTTLDLIGWSTAPNDVEVAVTRLDQMFIWLLELPWMVPWGFAFLSTAWLMRVSWPRSANQLQRANNFDESMLTYAKTSSPEQSLPVRNQTDLEWNFDLHKGMYFIGLSMPNDVVLVHQFQAGGKNNTKKPINKFRAYVRSDRDGAIFNTLFNLVGSMHNPEQLEPIPVDAHIDTYTYFISDKTGIPAREFLNEIAPITFVFEYDNKEYSRQFSINEMTLLIEKYEGEVNRSRIIKPAMRAKK